MERESLTHEIGPPKDATRKLTADPVGGGQGKANLHFACPKIR